MLERRAFLASLAALPMLGGGVKLIGQPTATAIPVSNGLLRNYEAWLAWERHQLHTELWDRDTADRNVTFLAMNLPGEQWHNPWRDEAPPCPPASTRAALVLSAVGCPLDHTRSLYAGPNVRRGL